MTDNLQQLVAQYESSWAWLTAVSIAVLVVLTAWGYVILTLFPQLRINRSHFSFFCESLLHGFLLSSVAGFAGVFLNIRVYQTFAIISSFFVLIWLLPFRMPYVNGGFLDQPECSKTENRLQGWALVLIIAGSLLWSSFSLRGLEEADGSIFLVPWVDFFFHARQIGNFAQFGGDFGTLNLAMYGEPLPPYHYASYMVSALVSYLGHIPSMQIATSLYPVFGMFLTGASIFVLASVTTGAASTFLAVALLFFLPDTSFWLPGSTRWNSYFFFQQVGVGGSYAVAIMGLALAYALRAHQLKSLPFCLIALFIFSVAGLFKVQIFLAYSIFFFLFVIWNADWISKKLRFASACVLIVAFCLAASKLGDIPGAPTFTIKLAGIEKSVGFISQFFYSSSPPLLVSLALLPFAAIKLFVLTYGFLFPASLYLAWKLRNSIPARKTLLLLGLGFFSHACVRLLIADNEGFGDFAEVKLKTFVWPYFVVVFCFSSLLWTYLVQEKAAPSLRNFLVVFSTACLFVLSLISAPYVQDSPNIRDFTNVRIQNGVFESAIYLRQNSPPTDVVQLCENDEYNQFASLSERPVYVAKVTINAPPMTFQERERFAFVDHILHQADIRSAESLMRQAQISWFLMSPKCLAKWEADISPAFSSHGYRLYKVSGIH
ncbi:hypothetical protein [Accumulibacter sp.]|uniref:hypothetical protein n=1 Tax=Accumulibacter sp. TaxID=2053492 RepID=UPI001A4DD08A|nr:hypothetical protein [Accumulibacter sp.]MBL8375688.1 hypothetical protein [Accumulibacter sp.]